ncbi:hypothetical protein [Lentibacillus amyloliquefaciens]|uniref:DUF5105 domain-containing protein n=1 Tax=Lentibacillus amyloliquefaciens TaxID=1472767 RepID=A0A0U4FUM4_9BACI|nr:hypothetical protein [Lentibacillus amyloliquefaciens]ALX49493.1 hypothetical protein AOX59_13495 [Lentibacillus amyloliquefaciens]
MWRKVSHSFWVVAFVLMFSGCGTDSTEAAKQAATEFKEMQFNIKYEEISEKKTPDNLEEIKETFGLYATEKESKYLFNQGIISYIKSFSRQTKSDLSVKSLSFEVGNVNTDDEISFDYDINIEVKGTGEKPETNSIKDFGQLVMKKTEEGWKVDKDRQQMDGFAELRQELIQ